MNGRFESILHPDRCGQKLQQIVQLTNTLRDVYDMSKSIVTLYNLFLQPAAGAIRVEGWMEPPNLHHSPGFQ
jgi:hypothetical protein